MFENLHLKKNDYSKLTRNYQIKDHERKKQNEVTNNEFEGVFILNCMPNVFGDWMSNYIHGLKDQFAQIGLDQFLVDYFKNFMISRGIHDPSVFLRNNELMVLFNQK